MKVRDAMTRHVQTLTPDALVIDAMRLMLRERVSGLPVVDLGGAVIGILTEGDLMRRAELGTERTHPHWLRFLLGTGQLAREYTASHGRRVDEVMTRDVVTIGADAPLADAVRLMEERHVKRLPVLYHHWLEGILSRADLMRAFVTAAPGADSDDCSDTAIARRIAIEFDVQPWTPRNTAHADVQGGVVTLRGVLLNDATRDALKVLVENVPGVVRVVDQLATVEPMTGTVVRLPDAAAR